MRIWSLSFCGTQGQRSRFRFLQLSARGKKDFIRLFRRLNQLIVCLSFEVTRRPARESRARCACHLQTMSLRHRRFSVCYAAMRQPVSLDPHGEIIDVSPVKPRRRRRWIWVALIAIVLLLIIASRSLSIYLSALWFGSLGYSPVYWYMFRLKIELFLIFLVLTIALLGGAFWLIERVFAPFSFERRTIFINQQPVSFSPARILRPLGWAVAVIAGLIFGLGMRESWRNFALYLHQASTDSRDPIFNKPVAFYLFTLPVYEDISSWL